jgi:nucleotide-binding universal stress UspA family protein
MSLKSIVVHLDEKEAAEQRIDVAVEIARRFRGRLRGVYSTRGTRAEVDIAELAPSEVARQISDREAQEHARSLLTRTAAAAALGEVEVHVLGADPVDEALAEMRCADVSVLSQPDFENDDRGFDRRLLQSALLGVGGPLLVLPRVRSKFEVARNIVIAWDGGREAARALRDALPMLASAARTTLLSIGGTHRLREDAERSQAQALRLLAAHGVSAKARRVECTIEPAELLLSQLSDLGADLLVMGAYGHARVREVILGGMTRAVIEKMTVPVFMSH